MPAAERRTEAATEGPQDGKPLIVITGADGSIGAALADRLMDRYRVVGLDRDGQADNAHCPMIAFDLTDKDSVREAFATLRAEHGHSIAAVIHLAAYFDFTGAESPLYQSVNVEGTRNLLDVLQDFEVGRFVYSSTMLVHRAANPGERISEESPVEPSWAYPSSKAQAEEVIAAHRGGIPVAILRLAGLYDEQSAVPTLSHQIARIYNHGLKSHLHSGNLRAGQAFIHRDDMLRLFEAAIERRGDLPDNVAILAGEEEAVSYQRLQDAIGTKIHGVEHWETLTLPKHLAKLGAKLEVAAEPVVPDTIDKGEKPFLRPFMIDLSSDHYALDISRARHLLGWEPEHFILDTLPAMIARLKDDPVAWHKANGVTVNRELEIEAQVVDDPDALRTRHHARAKADHAANRWAYFLCMALGTWLIVAPPILGYVSVWMTLSSVVGGAAVTVLGFLSLSWRTPWARWTMAAVGAIVMASPILFWASEAGAYVNAFLVGSLIAGFAVALKPIPGISVAAAATGPERPPGWSFNPSSWVQRAPVILLAFVGLYVSLYLCAYQLDLIDGVWEPFFAGSPSDPQNGTEEIITSSVSEAWPVPDAGLGAITYMLEIIVGLIGSTRRWRTMPWLVLLFGIMIVPLGAVSITFIIIQPLVIGTWSTLALIGALAMLIQIPYSLDELVATIDYLWRRWKKGDPVLWIFLRGGTDEGDARSEIEDEFDRAPGTIFADMWQGGVSLNWGLVLCLAAGLWLMLTRLTLGTEGALANADHLIGALALTVTVTATAELGRIVRFLNVPLGLAACLTPLILGGGLLQIVFGVIAGLALIIGAVPRGRVGNDYGEARRMIL
ncbi:Nucleoside-diphosphate-sugar epimerase [Palleronia marisminoris]|uniref:NAD-dependent epimerase/dehydratase family protein n=1 Tax=Palleronia marisminoris TaxID=315423 RepID=UPI0008E0627F|nr:NAD-dependent epimerase/dehydratase family protein [Palleronia marisminoris]SFH27089.1 Nucleoside-diphosphate-sugar epimerase [Palleronia marisminoris]